MTIDLFHGSDHLIKEPVFGYGKDYNDYGKAFYCTQEADLAKEWAALDNRDGVVNHYQLDEAGLSFLNLNEPGYSMLNWLALLLRFRSFNVANPMAKQAKDYLLNHFLPPFEDKDVIVGYRADDSYFSFAQDFLNNAISYRQLALAMHLGRLGEQVAIKSKLGFSHLRFVDYQNVSAFEWYRKADERNQAARLAYLASRNEPLRDDDLFVRDIVLRRIGNGDPILS
jgi:hypothetical protein